MPFYHIFGEGGQIMHRIMVVILAAIILLLVVVLLMQGKKKATMQIQINGLNEQLETLKTASSEKLKGREDILQAARSYYDSFHKERFRPLQHSGAGFYPVHTGAVRAGKDCHYVRGPCLRQWPESDS